ncbi:MAG TPA: hypothetical protein VNU21_18405 [Usitatibacter sp.]|nr:hypothetical protein [Usitatibacter sp.]
MATRTGIDTARRSFSSPKTFAPQATPVSATVGVMPYHTTFTM